MSLRLVSQMDMRSYLCNTFWAFIKSTLLKLSFAREFRFQLQKVKKLFITSPGFFSISLDKIILIGINQWVKVYMMERNLIKISRNGFRIKLITWDVKNIIFIMSSILIKTFMKNNHILIAWKSLNNKQVTVNK